MDNIENKHETVKCMVSIILENLKKMKKQDLIKGSKRIVIKVGSALLIDEDTGKT